MTILRHRSSNEALELIIALPSLPDHHTALPMLTLLPAASLIANAFIAYDFSIQ